jgi:acetyl coenzyme A synthetase (ADP forming)-like protein
MKDPLDVFFHPRGVAVVGASSDPAKLGYGVLHNLVQHGYLGKVYPVNPRGGEMMGLPAYGSVADVPEPVDLAVIVVSSDHAVEVLAQCGRRGIRAAVVIAGGFGELGASGEARQDELLKVAREHGMRFIGPNCVGVVDSYVPLDTTFIRTLPPQGSIGFVSHSGAVCGGTMDWAGAVGVGLSRVISLGNQADVDLSDALASLNADPHTNVAVAYIEGVPRGRRFVQTAAELTERKPLVVLKAGRTAGGARAVASHTGALAGTDAAFAAACDWSDIILVDSLEELVDAATALAYRLPPSGNRIVILTNAGGPAAVGADALYRQGLELVELTESTQSQLQEVCPPGTLTRNPVDMLGGPRPEHFSRGLRVLLDAPEVDGVMAMFVPQAVTPLDQVASAVGETAAAAHKPVVCCISGGGGIGAAARTLHAHSVPHYLTPGRAAFGLGVLYRRKQMQARGRPEFRPVAGVEVEEAARLVESAVLPEGGRALDAQEGAALAATYGLKTPASGLAGNAAEAVDLADRLGYPVALKRIAPGLTHKSDVGGVELGLRDAESVEAAFGKMVGAGERALVQQMMPKGLELIVGAQRDVQFGPLLMVGLGGTYVEVLKEVTFRLAPVSREDALEMVQNTAAGRLLAGVRGQAGGDVEAVVDSIRRLGRLMLDHSAIQEAEINPLIVGQAGEGAWAVDVRVIVGTQGGE